MSRADELLNVLIKTAYPEPRSDLHRSIVDKVWAEIVKPRAGLVREDLVLDIGAGDGYSLELFEREGLKAIGVNFLAEDVVKCTNQGLTCFAMDMHDLSGTRWDGEFSLVWMRHALEHSPFPMLALSEAYRVLKPGGFLYVEVPAPDTENKHGDNKNHWSLFPASFWTQLLSRSKFEICEQRELQFATLVGPDMYFLWLCKKRLL